MGLGIAIGGSIAALTVFVIILTYPMVSEKIVETSNARSEILDIQNKIHKTNFNIESLNATNSDNLVSFVISNIGSEKLWNFEEFTLIVTYDANIGGILTPTTEELTFNSNDAFGELSIQGVTNQFLRPDSDVTHGNWDDSCASCDTDSELFDEIDEEIQDDNDFVRSTTLLTLNDNDVFQISLSNPLDPLSTDQHTVRYAYQKSVDGGITIDLTVTLLQGTTSIASWVHNDIPTSFTLATQTLTVPQINTITNYSDLRLEFNAEYVAGTLPASEADISWAEFEIPPSPYDVDCSPIGLSDGEWTIDRMVLDVMDPQVINNGEKAQVCLNLANPVFAGGNVQVLVSNPNGVTGTDSITAT